MKIFVAGATGVVGSRTVTLLLAAGHQVTGLARSAKKADLLRRQGARAIQASLFDPDSLGSAIAGHDAVVNLATHIPVGATAIRARRSPRSGRRAAPQGAVREAADLRHPPLLYAQEIEPHTGWHPGNFPRSSRTWRSSTRACT
jgi:uncharacterized protein YbjT (DUF2867 family)